MKFITVPGSALKVIQTVSTRFCKTVICQTWRLGNMSVKHDQTVSKIIGKMSQRTTAQMNSHFFAFLHSILITVSLWNFKLACIVKGINEGATIWIFKIFMKKPGSEVLKTRVVSKQKAQSRMPSCGKTTTLNIYSQVVKHLLGTSVTDENIADTDEIVMFNQLQGKTPSQCAKDLKIKALQR